MLQCKSVDMTNDKLKLLLDEAVSVMGVRNKQTAAFGMIYAIVKRGFEYSGVYDILDKTVVRMGVESIEPAVVKNCTSIFVHFIVHYKMDHNSRLHRITRLLRDYLKSERITSRLNTLSFAIEMIKRFPVVVLEEYMFVFLLNLLERLINDPVPECRIKVAEVLFALFKKISLPAQEKMINYAIEQLVQKHDNLRKRMALHMLDILVRATPGVISGESFDKMMHQIQIIVNKGRSIALSHQSKRGGSAEEKQIAKQEEVDVKTLCEVDDDVHYLFCNTASTLWQLTYHALLLLNNTIKSDPITTQNYLHTPNSNGSKLMESVVGCVGYPHLLVRIRAMSTIATYSNTHLQSTVNDGFEVMDRSDVMFGMMVQHVSQLKFRQLDRSCEISNDGQGIYTAHSKWLMALLTNIRIIMKRAVCEPSTFDETQEHDPLLWACSGLCTIGIHYTSNPIRASKMLKPFLSIISGVFEEMFEWMNEKRENENWNIDDDEDIIDQIPEDIATRVRSVVKGLMPMLVRVERNGLFNKAVDAAQSNLMTKKPRPLTDEEILYESIITDLKTILNNVEAYFGHSLYIESYREVKTMIDQKARERKRQHAIDAVANPELAAQRKQKRAEVKRASRKRKVQKFRAKRGIILEEESASKKPRVV
eukprot:TRINITY_DN4_c0_g1_i4.p1 TRINITY_DN4_c0_g1~~TRINITY_DN4_c0_g1_i4.p1  ORF type:complete len:649 (+),score=198.71 TRINITY_DN4_c0_g1_i4:299-2245(+)